MFTPVRNVVYRTANIGATRLISHHNVSFADTSILSTHPDQQEKIKEEIKRYCARCGADKGGAYKADIKGAYHSGSAGHMDKFRRVTVVFYDQDGNRIYWHRKSDDSFWNLIHVPEYISDNMEIWEKEDDYELATQEEFEKSVHSYTLPHEG